MTKSTITRERLQEIAEDGFMKHGESKELARMALLAMDSEPVIWNNGCNKSVPAALRYLAENPRPIGGESSFNTAHLYQLAREIELMAEAPLYRHAQPAPVVPAVSDDIGEIRVGRLPTMNQDDYPGLGDWWVQLRIGKDSDEVLARVYGATPQEANNRAEALACRAAMLQAEPVCTCPSGDGSLRWPCPVHPSSSPVIPDGYVMVPKEPTKEMIDAGWLHYMGTKNPSSKGTYKAMLAAAPRLPGSEPATVPGKWIPVSEQVPTKQDGSVFLTWNGQYIGKELFLMGSFQCLKPEIITHWMPLPAAPQEVKSES